MYFDYMQFMFRDLENTDFDLQPQTFLVILARNGFLFEKKSPAYNICINNFMFCLIDWTYFIDNLKIDNMIIIVQL